MRWRDPCGSFAVFAAFAAFAAFAPVAPVAPVAQRDLGMAERHALQLSYDVVEEFDIWSDVSFYR
ncbi:hypothetical protein [Sorangium sp. So ce861]|uniref:hypothetical protein n=1 Tax=Sorangium sp. So ce861 TaxID=3133323 RepID=UPI003F643DAC